MSYISFNRTLTLNGRLIDERTGLLTYDVTGSLHLSFCNTHVSTITKLFVKLMEKGVIPQEFSLEGTKVSLSGSGHEVRATTLIKEGDLQRADYHFESIEKHFKAVLEEALRLEKMLAAVQEIRKVG